MTPHRWRLQFELRGDKGRVQAAAPIPQPPPLPAIPEESLDSAEKLIRTLFRRAHGASAHEAIGPEVLVSKLESALGRNKESWPLDAIRKLSDILAEVADGRAKSERHEARWLNMFGFCLRPGFGALRDDWRVNQALRLRQAGLVFPSDLQCQVQRLVLWRRVAGGLSRDQQREQYEEHASMLGVRGRKARGQEHASMLGVKEKKASGQRLNRQLEHEGWRLLASLEHLPVSLRAALGEELLARIKKEPADKAWLWSLGRLGERIPLYGPISCVVAVQIASKWLKTLLDLPVFTSDTASAVVQLGSRTNDRMRDIADSLRQRAIGRLEAAGFTNESSRGLQEYVPAAQADALRIFGESLPDGLRLVNCGLEHAQP